MQSSDSDENVLRTLTLSLRLLKRPMRRMLLRMGSVESSSMLCVVTGGRVCLCKRVNEERERKKSVINTSADPWMKWETRDTEDYEIGLQWHTYKHETHCKTSSLFFRSPQITNWHQHFWRNYWHFDRKGKCHRCCSDVHLLPPPTQAPAINLCLWRSEILM